MKKVIERGMITAFVIVLSCSYLAGCGASQTTYQREYAKVWKELIKSKAWQESLLAQNATASKELYASTENDVALAEDIKTTVRFEDTYQSLVSKAYFKIITEAEKADAQISAEYELMRADAAAAKGHKKSVHEITKKYEAHKAMLGGLKSWNIFSENRSGDLDYFKAENESAVQKMISAGEEDEKMINYLIYKLADLYHVEEN